jgi:signal transduction histidine kinase
MNRSIRGRILLVLLLAQGLLTAIAATAVVIYTHRQMLNAFDAELHRRMLSTLMMVQIADEQPSGIEFGAQPNTISQEDLYAIWDSHGVVVAASPHSTNVLYRLLPAEAAIFLDAHGHPYRGAVWHSVPVQGEADEDGEETKRPPPHIDLAYAMPADTLHGKLERVVISAVIGSCLFLLSCSLIAWLSVSRGLAPLNELAVQASKITERFWDFRTGSQGRDIEELLPLTGALEGLIRRLKAAFERERTFVGDAAHELKTAVAIQKSTLQVAAQGPANLAEYRKGFEQALSDVDRLEALVLRMLSLASLEGPALEDSFVCVALEETLLSACEELGPLAELRGIRIGHKDLASCTVWGDAGLLKTLWIALIENAIQYSPGGSQLTVASVAFNAETCRVTICDRGIGIAPDALPKIFDRFYRSDRSRSRETGGYGLGLAISKAIVERHHGTITIESTLGQGTAVNVDLPTAST